MNSQTGGLWCQDIPISINISSHCETKLCKFSRQTMATNYQRVPLCLMVACHILIDGWASFLRSSDWKWTLGFGPIADTETTTYLHKGSEWAWAPKKVLKKALKIVNPLKRLLFWAKPLFWVLKNALKRVDLLKRVPTKSAQTSGQLKKVLKRGGHSKECS